MSSAHPINHFLPILGGILILVLAGVAAINSGMFHEFVDPHGLLFVLGGGMALVMISSPFAEIGRALRHAAGSPGNYAAIRLSAFFWEAASRGFWILGVLATFFNLTSIFTSMASDKFTGRQIVLIGIAQSLLGVIYGILLAVICFIPYWKLMGKLQSLPSLPDLEPIEDPKSIERVRLRLSTMIGYLVFFLISALTIPNLSIFFISTYFINWVSLLVVLGGVLSLILFSSGVKSGWQLSMSFAVMGLIGSLMAFIQILFGMAGDDTLSSIAEGLNILYSSCLTALLGIILIGAPFEDRAIRIGRVATPLTFSRISWYAFPLLTLIFAFLALIIIIGPQ